MSGIEQTDLSPSISLADERAFPRSAAVGHGDAQRIYEMLFPGPIPQALEGRFAAAWRILADDYSEAERAEFRKAIDMGNDLEALELVCRRSKRLPVLRAQVALMVMLAETMPCHRSFYIHGKNEFIVGLISMTAGVFRTVWKLAKGRYLIRKLDAQRDHDRR